MPDPPTYEQTLTYLYEQLPMFQRDGAKAFKKDLQNTITLCEALGEPQQAFRSVHVGGTNGKGSVAHLLASAFQAAGYRTGLYTSPHLRDFRERIKIDGKPVSRAFVVDFVRHVQPMIDKVGPSFFELTVVMAFEAFRRAQVEVAVIEVGMGGRLDSTNVVLPELSVITNIGYDHMAFLGDTLPEIAREKAGIIKEQVPCVLGRRQVETAGVFQEVAHARQAPLHFAEELVRLQLRSDGVPGEALMFDAHWAEGEPWSALGCPLASSVQTENLGTALAALHLLRPAFPALGYQSIRVGLATVIERTGLEGRWQVLGHEPLRVVDVAHNQDGLRGVGEQLRAMSYRRLHFVYGASNDKDLTRILPLLPREAMYYFCAAALPRAYPAEALAHACREAGLIGQSYPSVEVAWQTACHEAGPQDLVLACGSLFVVGEVLALYAWKEGEPVV